MVTQQTAQLQDGAEYIGRPTAPEYGKTTNGKMEIRLYMEVVEGPLAGRRVKYTAGTKDPRSTAFAKRDLKAAGWQGVDIRTFVADVEKVYASGAKLPFTVRLARYNRDDGSVSEWWTVHTIGVSAVPLVATAPADDDMVNQWFGDVEDLSSAPQTQQTQTPAQSAPAQQQTATRGSGHPNAPGSGPAPF